MIAANLVGADGGGFFKFKNGKVDEITTEGRAFLDIYKTTYNGKQTPTLPLVLYRHHISEL